MKNEKGIELATDLLKQINTLNIASGDYISGKEFSDIRYSSEHCVKSAQLYMETLKKCNVCAKGALCLIYVEKYNNVTVYDLYRSASSGISNTLREFFSEEQLDLIEAAFECWDTFIDSDEKIDWDFTPYQKIPPKIRLQLIMENIIENDGFLDCDKLVEIYEDYQFNNSDEN